MTEAMIELVKAGMGITVMTRWSIAPQLEDGSLVAVAMTREGLWRDWSVARLRRKNTPAYITEFLRLLTDDPLGTLTRRHAKVTVTRLATAAHRPCERGLASPAEREITA